MKTIIKVVATNGIFAFDESVLIETEGLFTMPADFGGPPEEQIRPKKSWKKTDPRVAYMTREELIEKFPRTGRNTLLWLDRENRGFDYIGVHENGAGTPFKVTHCFFLVQVRK